jgi:hypothetical protein
MNEETAKKLIQFIAKNTRTEDGTSKGMKMVFMKNPIGLIDLIRDEAKIDPNKIPVWVKEARR